MGPITAIIPVVRRIELAGRLYRVGEFRLIDLAELQFCLEESQADPVEDVFSRLGELEGPERHKAIADAHEAAVEPPTIWDDRGSAWLDTVEGLATLLLIALQRHQSIEAEDCVRIANEITPYQLDRLRRIVFGVRSLKVLERLLGLSEPSRRGKPIRWPQLVAEVADAYHTADLPVIYSRTLTEFAALRSGGKVDDEEGRELAPGEDLAKAVAEQRRRFYGDNPPPDEV